MIKNICTPEDYSTNIRCTETFFIALYAEGSVVGTAIGYGLDGPGIESLWGRDFPHQSRPALGPTQPPLQWDTGSFLV